jgi:hypothetical protein
MFKSLFQKFNILMFAKVMSFLIIFITTMNFAICLAADASTNGISWNSVKASAMQWVLGILAASLTTIVGYAATLLKDGIKHLFNLIRTYSANTRLQEMLDDLEAFCLNETATIETMTQEALKTNNDVDSKELQAICEKVVNDAKAMWGEETLRWAEVYRPMLNEWLLSRAKAIVRGIIDRFRSRQSSAVTTTN